MKFIKKAIKPEHKKPRRRSASFSDYGGRRCKNYPPLGSVQKKDSSQHFYKGNFTNSQTPLKFFLDFCKINYKKITVPAIAAAALLAAIPVIGSAKGLFTGLGVAPKKQPAAFLVEEIKNPDDSLIITSIITEEKHDIIPAAGNNTNDGTENKPSEAAAAVQQATVTEQQTPNIAAIPGLEPYTVSEFNINEASGSNQAAAQANTGYQAEFAAPSTENNTTTANTPADNQMPVTETYPQFVGNTPQQSGAAIQNVGNVNTQTDAPGLPTADNATGQAAQPRLQESINAATDKTQDNSSAVQTAQAGAESTQTQAAAPQPANEAAQTQAQHENTVSEPAPSTQQNSKPAGAADMSQSTENGTKANLQRQTPESASTSSGGVLTTETVTSAAQPEQQPGSTAQSNTADTEKILIPEQNHPDVIALQQRLMDLGYMDNDEPTDYYGPATQWAVRYFQRKHGLTNDGFAGAETQALLFSDAAQPYSVTLNAEGPDVERIQERLAELGYPVTASGYFGSDTDYAVRYFQRMNGLTDDGSVGHDTKEILYSRNAEPALEYKANNSGSAQNANSSNKSSSNKTSETSEKSSSDKKSESSSDSVSYTSNPGNVEAFIDAAMAQVGKSYVLGGKGPNVFDCSGFVYYALKQSGNGIGYMTSGGWANSGYTTVGSVDSLKRGDVICMRGHVGIYLGGGQMVDASSSLGKIVVRDVGSWARRNFICGKRPL